MDLSQVDLNLLVSLEILLQERNVTRAAQRLDVSQPAMSAQLGRLRTLFNDPLLLPAESGRGMTPTALALTLAIPLSAALKGLEKVINFQPDFNPCKDSREFNIAMSDDAILAVGIKLVARLQALGPHKLRLNIHRPQPDHIATELERGEVDLLIDLDRMIPSSMKARTLYEGGFVMAQRPGHPRGTAVLDLDTYCNLDHLLVSSASGNAQGYMDEYLANQARQRRVVMKLPQLSLIPNLLRSSDYVCTLPAIHFIQFGGDLELYDLPFVGPGFSLQLAWHPRNHFDPAVIWMRDFIQQVAERLQA
ncbi:LysR family transcriptional regulator [Pseudomonas gingeri]|uniref:LysR family transcriptional regulator n=1 Tax=Pseudomonas gingeri TaxID=117681 RepID=A0A7Y7WQP1_9PSED|nr:LysR family transcriptional regulator [Pseudomonas gingeri]NWB85871.1 LysR family transcriptional regulator [Pseudomonas gingeri]